MFIGIVDPAFGRATHVDHKHHGDVALQLEHFSKQAVGHFLTVPGIGEGLHQRIDIHVITVWLFFQLLVFTAQCLKATP